METREEMEATIAALRRARARRVWREERYAWMLVAAAAMVAIWGYAGQLLG